MVAESARPGWVAATESVWMFWRESERAALVATVCAVPGFDGGSGFERSIAIHPKVEAHSDLRIRMAPPLRCCRDGLTLGEACREVEQEVDEIAEWLGWELAPAAG